MGGLGQLDLIIFSPSAQTGFADGRAKLNNPTDTAVRGLAQTERGLNQMEISSPGKVAVAKFFN